MRGRQVSVGALPAGCTVLRRSQTLLALDLTLRAGQRSGAEEALHAGASLGVSVAPFVALLAYASDRDVALRARRQTLGLVQEMVAGEAPQTARAGGAAGLTVLSHALQAFNLAINSDPLEETGGTFRETFTFLHFQIALA